MAPWSWQVNSILKYQTKDLDVFETTCAEAVCPFCDSNRLFWQVTVKFIVGKDIPGPMATRSYFAVFHLGMHRPEQGTEGCLHSDEHIGSRRHGLPCQQSMCMMMYFFNRAVKSVWHAGKSGLSTCPQRLRIPRLASDLCRYSSVGCVPMCQTLGIRCCDRCS